MVKTTTLITDMNNIPAFREVRARYLHAAHPPANTLIPVAGLARPSPLLEIEAVADLDDASLAMTAKPEDGPAYVVVQIAIEDPVAYERYKVLAPPSIAAYGGRYVVRGGASEILEGTWRPPRLVALEFSDGRPRRGRGEPSWSCPGQGAAPAVGLDGDAVIVERAAPPPDDGRAARPTARGGPALGQSYELRLPALRDREDLVHARGPEPRILLPGVSTTTGTAAAFRAYFVRSRLPTSACRRSGGGETEPCSVPST